MNESNLLTKRNELGETLAQILKSRVAENDDSNALDLLRTIHAAYYVPTLTTKFVVLDILKTHFNPESGRVNAMDMLVLHADIVKVFGDKLEGLLSSTKEVMKTSAILPYKSTLSALIIKELDIKDYGERQETLEAMLDNDDTLLETLFEVIELRVAFLYTVWCTNKDFQP